MQRTDSEQVKLVREHLFVGILIWECFAYFLKVDFLFGAVLELFCFNCLGVTITVVTYYPIRITSSIQLCD